MVIHSKSKTLHGLKAERRASKRLGGRCQPGSGNIEGAKGDIKLPARRGMLKVLAESKSTTGESLSIKKAWLDKISEEAVAINCTPALIVQFVDATGRPVRRGSWVALPEATFNELCNPDEG